MTFGHVPWNAAQPLWEAAAALLAPALRHGRQSTLAGLVADLKGQRAQLWIEHDNGTVTGALVTCRSGATLEIWLCGGRWADDWTAHLERIAEAARDAGCARMELTGRKGWKRKLPGWTVNGPSLERML